MIPTLNFNTIADYNNVNNHETLHPLVSVLDMSKALPREWKAKTVVRMQFGIYCVMLKNVKCGDLRYGRNTYDYQEGTLVFFSPGQTVDVEYEVSNYQPLGNVLAFHPDLLRGTNLGKNINSYSFFTYAVNEALHLSEKEKQMTLDSFAKIQYELSQSIDKHSKTLITSHIELFLNYCTRFYDRQFITRDNVHRGILERFEELLNGYFSSTKPQNEGLPSVSYCAGQLNLSSNYFGDLIKKETGKSAQEYIQTKVIDVAKEQIFDIDKSISEVAYNLGFKYPQHFTRLFKQKTGVTPKDYRMLN